MKTSHLAIQRPSMPEQGVFCYEEAFCRNLGLLTLEEQEKLRTATIAIPGLGGVGGIHLATLARMGIGGFHLADDDEFSLANFNRQYGATVSSIGQSKLEVMRSIARDINPELRLKSWNSFINKRNVETFLDGCDLVVDSLDAFAIEARRTLFTTAQAMRIPVITAGPIGFSTAMLVFTPDSMGFDAYFNWRNHLGPREQFLHFIGGLTPKPYFFSYMNTGNIDMNEKRGPCIASSVALCAGFAATEAIKILLNRKKVFAVPHYHYFDPYLMKFKIGYLPFGNRNFLQRIKYYIITKFVLKTR